MHDVEVSFEPFHTGGMVPFLEANCQTVHSGLRKAQEKHDKTLSGITVEVPKERKGEGRGGVTKPMFL